MLTGLMMLTDFCDSPDFFHVASPAGNLTKSWNPDKYIFQALNWQQKGNKTQEAGDTTFDTDIHDDQRTDSNDSGELMIFLQPTMRLTCVVFKWLDNYTIRMKCNNFGDPSTFHPAPSSG